MTKLWHVKTDLQELLWYTSRHGTNLSNKKKIDDLYDQYKKLGGKLTMKRFSDMSFK
jgi:hypothetical protein